MDVTKRVRHAKRDRNVVMQSNLPPPSITTRHWYIRDETTDVKTYHPDLMVLYYVVYPTLRQEIAILPAHFWCELDFCLDWTRTQRSPVEVLFLGWRPAECWTWRYANRRRCCIRYQGRRCPEAPKNYIEIYVRILLAQIDKLVRSKGICLLFCSLALGDWALVYIYLRSRFSFQPDRIHSSCTQKAVL